MKELQKAKDYTKKFPFGMVLNCIDICNSFAEAKQTFENIMDAQNESRLYMMSLELNQNLIHAEIHDEIKDKKTSFDRLDKEKLTLALQSQIEKKKRKKEYEADKPKRLFLEYKKQLEEEYIESMKKINKQEDIKKIVFQYFDSDRSKFKFVNYNLHQYKDTDQFKPSFEQNCLYKFEKIHFKIDLQKINSAHFKEQKAIFSTVISSFFTNTYSFIDQQVQLAISQDNQFIITRINTLQNEIVIAINTIKANLKKNQPVEKQIQRFLRDYGKQGYNAVEEIESLISNGALSVRQKEFIRKIEFNKKEIIKATKELEYYKSKIWDRAHESFPQLWNYFSYEGKILKKADILKMGGFKDPYFRENTLDAFLSL